MRRAKRRVLRRPYVHSTVFAGSGSMCLQTSEVGCERPACVTESDQKCTLIKERNLQIAHDCGFDITTSSRIASRGRRIARRMTERHGKRIIKSLKRVVLARHAR